MNCRQWWKPNSLIVTNLLFIWYRANTRVGAYSTRVRNYISCYRTIDKRWVVHVVNMIVWYETVLIGKINKMCNSFICATITLCLSKGWATCVVFHNCPYGEVNTWWICKFAWGDTMSKLFLKQSFHCENIPIVKWKKLFSMGQLTLNSKIPSCPYADRNDVCWNCCCLKQTFTVCMVAYSTASINI